MVEPERVCNPLYNIIVNEILVGQGKDRTWSWDIMMMRHDGKEPPVEWLANVGDLQVFRYALDGASTKIGNLVAERERDNRRR